MISALRNAKNIHIVEQKMIILRNFNINLETVKFVPRWRNIYDLLQAVNKAVKSFSKTQYKSVN